MLRAARSRQALAQLLACAQSRALAAIEQALLLRELIDGQQMSQRDAARQCGRDASWVQRRLLLLQRAARRRARGGARRRRVELGGRARVRAVGARQRRSRAAAAGQRVRPQSAVHARAASTWFAHYQRAQRAQRERMVEHPRLFIDSLSERDREREAQPCAAGPSASWRATWGSCARCWSACARRSALFSARWRAAGACVPPRARGAARGGG